MTSSSGTRSSTVVASAWDPRSPSALMMAGGGGGDGGRGGDAISGAAGATGGTLAAFYSDDGVGCNDYETSALIRMLDARDQHTAGDLRSLSREYRRAVRDCMGGWEDHIRKSSADAAAAARGAAEGGGGSEGGADETNETEGDAEAEANNLELLKITSAIIHLSEIYLLPRHSGSPSSGSTGMHIDDGGGSNARDNNLPGSVTADTVRYLRLNHLPDVYDIIDTTPEEVERMMDSEQPEHYAGGGARGGAGGGALFWSLVEALAIRGCLAEAWAVLTHHSAVRRFSAAAARGDLDGTGAVVDDPILLEDRDAFAILKGMMLCAPLPGGIDQANDYGLDEGDEYDEEREQDDNRMMSLDEDDDDGDMRLVAGVPRKSYELWDSDDGGESGNKAGSRRSSSDDALPGTFHPRAAANRHRTWSTAVARAAEQAGPLQSLTRRIPRLRRLLSILCGQFDESSSSGIGFRSWDEALCAELLYVRPNVRPNDIGVRARLSMKSYGLSIGADDGGGAAVEEIVLSVMSGDAGRAVLSLQGYGGSSGAALPATMVSFSYLAWRAESTSISRESCIFQLYSLYSHTLSILYPFTATTGFAAM